MLIKLKFSHASCLMPIAYYYFSVLNSSFTVQRSMASSNTNYYYYFILSLEMLPSHSRFADKLRQRIFQNKFSIQMKNFIMFPFKLYHLTKLIHLSMPRNIVCVCFNSYASLFFHLCIAVDG